MFKTTLTFVILLFFTQGIFAEKLPPITTPATVSEQLNQLLASYPENLNIGIMVIDAKTHKVIYKKNADRYFIPASTQKLFTAFAALNFLKPDFVYQTYLFADLQKVTDGSLNDHLYFKFSGDPLLSFAQLEQLISKLSAAGVKKIAGNIIIDDTAFNQISMSPGTTWDDQYFCYGSPISAIIVNHNCVSATLQPSQLIGGLALVNLPDYPQEMTFKSAAKTYLPNQTNCSLKVSPIDEETYLIKGCIKSTDANQPIMMAVRNPQSNVKNLLFFLLKKYQITHNNQVNYQPINFPVKLLASVSSPPLPAMITMMLKDSDNTIANALFKTIGSFHAREAGTWSNGRRAVHEILKNTAHLELPKKTLFDGSGASRYNYLTPQQITSLLFSVYSLANAKQFITALPISGMDGTLKNRMQSPSLTGKIFAKTGTESGVTTLSGFIRTKMKKTLIFSIMINGFTDSPAKYKNLEDKICEILVNANEAPIMIPRLPRPSDTAKKADEVKKPNVEATRSKKPETNISASG